MGWGGARVGAGKKPKPKAALRSPFEVFKGAAPASDNACLEPPEDLTEEQKAFWRTNAPLAIERRTLTPETIPAFRLLCELDARRAFVGRKIDAGDVGGLRIFAQLAKQVEGLMARFCLAPFGKPVDGVKKKPAANPWSKLADHG